MRDQEWDSTLAKLDALDLSELVLGLLSLDTVDGEASLGIVDKTEVLAGLLDGDDIHETSWVGGISADFSVDLDEALHDDGLGLAGVQGILETVANEDDQWHAVTELVWTWGWARGIGSGQFVQQPVGWGAKALLVLLSARAISSCLLVLPSCNPVRSRIPNASSLKIKAFSLQSVVRVASIDSRDIATLLFYLLD